MLLGSGHQRGMNEWNKKSHELALARSRAAQSGTRQSRFTYWAEALRGVLGKEHNVSCDESFSPWKPGQSQGVFFRLDDQHVRVGLVMSVFRAAYSKSRRLRVSKPMASPLPMGHTALLHIVQLTDAGGGVFLGTAMSRVHMVDPVGSVLQAFALKEICSDESGCSYKVDPELIAHVRQKEVPVLGGRELPQTAPPPTQKPSERFTSTSFPRSQQGYAAIAEYVGHLPELYKQTYKKDLLDEKGCWNNVPYQNITARAAEYYQNLFNTTSCKSSVEFSRKVQLVQTLGSSLVLR